MPTSILSLARILQLEPPGHLLLEQLRGVVLPAHPLQGVQARRPVPRQRILPLGRVVQIQVRVVGPHGLGRRLRLREEALGRGFHGGVVRGFRPLDGEKHVDEISIAGVQPERVPAVRGREGREHALRLRLERQRERQVLDILDALNSLIGEVEELGLHRSAVFESRSDESLAAAGDVAGVDLDGEVCEVGNPHRVEGLREIGELLEHRGIRDGFRVFVVARDDPAGRFGEG